MIKVEIDNDIRWIGIEAKDKFPGFKDFGCAKFLEPIVLYRGMLRQELIHILSHQNEEIKGGDFSIPLERYFGASYAYNIKDAAKAAQAIHEPYFTNKRINQNQSKYVIGIQAKDEIFGHLSLNKYIPWVDGKYYPNEPFKIDPKIGYLGLGFSVLVKPDKIVKIYKLEDKKLIDVTNNYKNYIGKNESELEQLVEIHNVSKKEDIDRAISEIRSLGIQNPFFYRELLLYNNVGIELSNWDGALHISSIRTMKKGTGDATKAMKQICDIADKNNVVITIYVKPFGYEDNRLNTTQLKAWYKRLGFKLQKYNDMERLPNKLNECKLKLKNFINLTNYINI
jgi:hypothetical protein